MTDPASGSDELTKKVTVYKRAYEREKARREYVEKMLEDQSRNLYVSNEKLIYTSKALTDANLQLEDQLLQLNGLSSDYDRVKQDLYYAAKIQSDLLPSALVLPEMTILGDLKPAQFIAGDGFDYFFIDGNTLAFYMIDVVGHGVASAMISIAVQMQLNPKQDGICKKMLMASSDLEDAVHKTLYEINDNFYDEQSTMQNFTMVYGLLNIASGEVALGQAGHPQPMHWRSGDDEIVPLGKGGTPLAMLDTPLFGTVFITLDPGDRLYLYSDGVTECRNQHDVEFDSNNLIAAIRQGVDLPLAEAASLLSRAATEWNGSEEFEDDLSFVLIEFGGRNAS